MCLLLGIYLLLLFLLLFFVKFKLEMVFKFFFMVYVFYGVELRLGEFGISWFCSRCGYKINMFDKFCVYCGKVFSEIFSGF